MLNLSDKPKNEKIENTDKTEESILDNLFNLTPEKYGKDYDDKLFEQYKIYVEMAKINDDRKATANTFFLSINTALLSALGLLFTLGITASDVTGLWIFGGSIAGIIFAYTWIRTIRWLSQLNKARWKIIQKIEKKLPLRIYDTEWDVLIADQYNSLKSVENNVPKVFIGLYFFLILISGLLGLKMIEFGVTSIPSL